MRSEELDSRGIRGRGTGVRLKDLDVEDIKEEKNSTIFLDIAWKTVDNFTVSAMIIAKRTKTF